MPDHRLLIVEDEAIVALDLEERLAGMGYQLTGQAVSGAEAIKFAQEQRPDLVLMDIRLQGDLDGITVAQEIRDRFHIPVIFLTAYAEDDTLERAKLSEPFGYLLKPFNGRELKSAIEIALYNHRAETEIRRLNRLYDVLSQINQTVVRVSSQEELLHSVCRVLVERGGIDLAWVGWLDPAASRLNPAAACGRLSDTLQPVDVTANANISSQAVSSGRPVVSNQCLSGQSIDFSPGPGVQSWGSFPLHFQGRIAGVLTICASVPGFFGERETGLLKEICLDISFALDKIEADAKRRQAEAALKESLSLYRTAMESTADGILVVNLEGEIISWNRRFTEMWRLTDEIVNSRDFSRIRAFFLDQLLDPQGFLTRIDELAQNPSLETCDLIHFKDGRVFERYSIPHYLDNRLVGRVLSFRDITGRIQAEQTLKQSEAFLNSIIEYSPNPLWIADGQGILKRLNQACRELFKIDDAEVVDKYNVLNDNIVADQGAMPLVREVFENGRTASFTLSYDSSRLQQLELDHTVNVVFDITMSPVLDAQGKVANVIIQHRDITAQVQAEAALRKNEDHFRKIFENAATGIAILDLQGRYQQCNPAFCAIVGYSEEELRCFEFASIIHPEDLESNHAQVRLLQAGELLSFKIENRYLRKDGQPVWVRKFVSMLPDETGKSAQFLTLVSDITASKQLQEALRRERDKFRNVLENIPFGVYIASASYDIEYVNIVLAKDFGPVDGRRCYQYFHDRAEPCPWCKNSWIFEGRSVRWEWKSDKTGKIYDLFDMPLVNEDGSISKLQIFQDITERKRVDQALRDNEQFLTDIFDNIQDGLCVLDTDLNVVRVNPAITRIPHLEPIAGNKCYAARHGRKEPCQVCAVQDAMASGLPSQKIIEFCDFEGNSGYAEIHAYPLRDQAGRIQGAIEYVRDVTQRIRMEQELRESELFLQKTQKIAHLGGWLANPLTDYLKWTEGVYDLFEAPRDYRPPLSEGVQFFLPEYIPILKESLAHCLATGEPFCLECRGTTTTGKQLWTEIRGLALIIEGERTNVIGTIQDITDRKQAEATRQELENRLFQSQKLEAIGTLAGGIAHDFNNILWAIQGYTEIAAASLADPDQVADYLNQVVMASQRAKDLVGQILAFSRKLESRKQPLLLKVIVAEVLKLLRASLPSTIEIRQQLFSKTSILADATQIHQIIMNLATNAFHAMEDTGGSLDFKLTDVRIDQPLLTVQGELPPGQYVALTITDSGPGIIPDLLPRIFEPYFTTKEVGKGTGLGLATVLGIIKSHGGEIVVGSQPGQGTTFTLYLPALPATPIDIAPADLETTLQGHGRILFVDDEPALIELGKTTLGRLGYQVIAVANSRDALEVFRLQPEAFDLIITDLTMPQMTGLDLARACQTIRPGIPVILCTGYADRVSREMPGELGIREILLKPLGLQKLGQCVKKILTDRTSKPEFEL